MGGPGYVAWRRVKRLALILVLTMTAAAALAAAPAGAQEQYIDPFAWKKCSTKVNSHLKVVQANNIKCRGAKRVIGRYHGSIKRKFKAPSGFRCKRVKGKATNGVWRCASSTKAFKFKYAR
jgi:hypothetical protein